MKEESMSQKGLTLTEILVVALLIPLIGLAIVQLDFFSHNYFHRTTHAMVSEQEVEMSLGAMARDITMAHSLEVWAGGVPVLVGTAGDSLFLTLDDDITPEDSTDDDEVEYRLNGGSLIREYVVMPGPAPLPDQTIARNVTALVVMQTIDEAALLPRNVIRATVSATSQGVEVTRTRYMASRVLSAPP